MEDINVQRSPFSCPCFPSTDVYGLLEPYFTEYAKKIAFIESCSGISYTYSELQDEVERVAFGMSQHGVCVKDTVAFYAQNSLEFVVMNLATWRLGAVFCGINHLLTAHEAEKLVKIVELKYIFTDATSVTKVLQFVRHVPTIQVIFSKEAHPGCVSYASLSLRRARTEMVPRKKSNINDVACILFSSGTTGLPKAVMLSHINFVFALTMWTDPINCVPNKGHQVVFLPMSHGYGIIQAVGGIMVGSTTILMKQFNLDIYLQNISTYKIDSLVLVPPIVVLLAKHPSVSNYDLSHLREIRSGAAPLGEDAIIKLQQRLGNRIYFRQGYGVTEAAACCTNQPVQSVPVKVSRGSVGFPLAGLELKVVDIETGKSLGPDLQGEIHCRGPNIMLGYANNPTASAKAVDSAGWFHTGDIGYYKTDGSFFVVDRLKDLIKYKGYQVAPAELEDLLLSHPLVSDVAVIGIPHPDAGEVPRAFVVRKDVNLKHKDLLDFVEGKVATYKRLRGGIQFVDSILKSPSGKILRHQIKKSVEIRKGKL